MSTCPVCQKPLTKEPGNLERFDGKRFECPRCGLFEIDGLQLLAVQHQTSNDALLAARMSYAVRRLQREGQQPYLTAELWDSLVANTVQPTPVEQVENLILFVGDSLPVPGAYMHVSVQEHTSVIGSQSDDTFFFVLEHAIEEGFLSGSRNNIGATATLSFGGWEKYEELKRTFPSRTRRAFMAMPFGQPDVENAFTHCFRPAAASAGYTLRKLDEQPAAGSIDDRLRLEIRRSRFLIADLTRGNHGAYWEAGYAEGLGLPVFYTCERSYFETSGTHFDTSHLQTVLWESSDLGKATKELTLAIRVTLPSEAVLEG